jgi:AraC-like DNA-binding protein
MPLATHIHSGAELAVVLEGEERRYYGEFSEERSFRLLPGDVSLIPMWEPHGWEVVRANTKVVAIHFLPEFLGAEMIGDVSWLSGFAAAPDRRPRVRGQPMRRRVMAIARDLWTEIEEQRYGWVTAVRSGLLWLLAVLYRSWEHLEDGDAATRSSLHVNSLARIMPAVAALQHQPSRRITISEAASRCGLGRRHFQRLFSQTMGVAFQKFCLRARLSHVEQMLTATDLPIEAVARDAGFVDLSHLHRHFVKHYGCTPGAYRLRAR